MGVSTRGTMNTINYAESKKKVGQNNELVYIIYIHIYRGSNMNYKLTSVKILKELYKNFKTSTLESEFTLQS